jgi:hypothetical protein
VNFAQYNTNRLFSDFRLKQLIKSSWIIKEKGYTPLEMLSLVLLMILERSHSLYSGITSFHKEKLKTPFNNILNDEHCNWRKLLFMIANDYNNLHKGG